MNTPIRLGIVALLLVVIGATLALKSQNAPGPPSAHRHPPGSAPAGGAAASAHGENPDEAGPLPRLVDLGASKCIPCRKMAPILADLSREYAGRMIVEFIDVWEHPEKAEFYRVSLIPTQIFFDPAGKELYRHEGFYSREDILKKWKELGVNFESTSVPGPGRATD